MNAGYSYIQKGNDYEFYTTYGSAYVVSFIDAGVYFKNHFLNSRIFTVDIKQTDTGPYNYYDYVVGITVAEIIFHFFESDDSRVVFYICDPTDGRINARKRKFKRWFENFNSGEFKMIESLMKNNTLELSIAFIFHKNNPFAYDLPTIIDKAKDDLGNK